METEKSKNIADTKDTIKEKKKKVATRKLIVLIALLFFIVATYISIRAEYLNTIEIGQEYENVFIEKIKNRYMVFGVAFISVYILVYIMNKFISFYEHL